MPIKVVIQEHMTKKHGPAEGWPSKVDMAETLGMQTHTVRSWLNESITRLDLETLDKWCDYFGVKTGDILVREES